MSDQHWTVEEVERFADHEAAPEDRHLRECARCAGAVLAASQMKRAVRAAMDDRAPASLRVRLTKPQRSSLPWWTAAAAAIALVLLGSLFLTRRESPVLPELVDMHVTMLAAASPVDVISTDRHTVKP